MMPHNNLSERESSALQAYLTAAQARFGPHLVEVLLFGSKARGEAGPSSDVDIIVILARPTVQDLSDARGLAFDVLLSYGVYLSVRAMSRQAWQTLARRKSMFYRNVLRDGISLVPAAT
jgi:predicted nucleotidyltransferase